MIRAVIGIVVVVSVLSVAFVHHGHQLFEREGVPLAAGEWTDIAATVARHPLTAEASVDVPVQRGLLTYRGGLELKSEHPAFGGFSGFDVGADGQSFTALSDRGFWLEGTLIHDVDGTLTDVSDLRMAPLTDDQGAALQGRAADSEGLHPTGEGFLVSFEREPRVAHYRRQAAKPPVLDRIIVNYGALDHLRTNQSLEGVTRSERGQIIVGVQHNKDRPDQHQFYRSPQDAFYLARTKPFYLTEIAFHRARLFLLERHYSKKTGQMIRVSMATVTGTDLPLETSTPVELARFDGSDRIDNFEGMALRTHDGRTQIFMISDDNFSGKQKTLLMQFDLSPGVE
ncbi:MAG: esterase-like activity of phytase family protein [Pseudomonadota bacterium]